MSNGDLTKEKLISSGDLKAKKNGNKLTQDYVPEEEIKKMEELQSQSFDPPHLIDLSDVIETVTTVPAHVPKKFYDQFKIYVDSISAPTDKRLYIYSNKTNAWNRFDIIGSATDLTVKSLTIAGTAGNVLAVDTNVLIVDATNNRVGINVTAPLTPFHLNVGTDQNLWVRSNSGEVSLKSVNDAPSATTAMDITANPFYFRDPASDAITVTVNGNGGIELGAPTGGNKGLGTINGTALYENNVRVMTANLLNMTTDNAEIANTTTETNLFSFTLAGGTLGTGNTVQGRILIAGFRNTGSETTTIRLYYDSVAISIVLTPATIEMHGYIDFLITAAGATNAQDASMTCWFGEQNTTRITTSGFIIAVGTNNSMAIDSTANKTLKVTVQHSAADANVKIKAFQTIVTKLLI